MVVPLESLPGESKDDVVEKALTGTTLKVYRYAIVQNKAVGAREVQRALNLSSPALAVFHLDKLVNAGLLSKLDEGGYVVERTYLKHYIRLRRFLIPRYMFYATLATLFTVGWVVIVSVPESNFWKEAHSGFGFTLISFLSYGVAATAICAGLFWFETYKVFRNDQL